MRSASTRVLLSSLAVLLLAASAHGAASISVSAASTYGSANTYPIADGVTEGLDDALNSHWNNIGTSNTGEGAGNLSIANLVNSDGAASGASFSLTLSPAGNTIIGQGGDVTGKDLFKGALSSHYGRAPVATVSNIPYLKYDVVTFMRGALSQNVLGATLVGTNAGGAYTNTITPTSDGGDFTVFNDATTDLVGNYVRWTGLTGSSFTLTMSGGGDRKTFIGLQIINSLKPIISIADGDWASGPTWDLDPTTPVTASDFDVTVRHNVSFAETAQTVMSLTLDNANSNLAIPAGKALTSTGPVEAKLGSLTVNGGLTASKLNVSGGAATIAAGSTVAIPTVNTTSGTTSIAAGTIGTANATGGTTSIAGGTVTTLNTSATGTAVSGGAVTTANVTGGSATLSGGTIGTVNASAGTTALGTTVTNLNVSGSAAVLSGAGVGATTVKLTGGTVDTQGNHLAVSGSLQMAGTTISASGASVGVKGSAITPTPASVESLKLNGGTVTVTSLQPTAILSEGFETDGTTTRYTSNTNLADPAAVAGTTDVARWGRVTSVPTAAFYSNGSNPTEGSVMWMAEQTTGLTGYRTTDGLEQTNASWLDLNALNVAGKTGLKLTVDLMASGNASGSGPENNDEFKIRVKNVATGVVTDVEYMEGQGNAPYKSKINGTQLNTPGVAKSMTYDLSGLGLTGDMQVIFAHSQTGGNGVEYLAFDNVKVWADAPAAISMASTTIEVALDTTLDIGGSASVSFLDLVLAAGVSTDKTLHLQGSNSSAVSTLASFFDVTAPNAANVSITGSGAGWADLLIAAGSTWPGYIAGDFNKDGQVGPEDFGILKDNFGSSNLAYGSHDSWTLGDANDDGQVGPEDFGLLKDNFGTSNGPTGTYPLSNVPEPATLALLALGGLLAARKNRR